MSDQSIVVQLGLGTLFFGFGVVLCVAHLREKVIVAIRLLEDVKRATSRILSILSLESGEADIPAGMAPDCANPGSFINIVVEPDDGLSPVLDDDRNVHSTDSSRAAVSKSGVFSPPPDL